MHIKQPLLLIGNSNPYGSSGFSLSLSELSFTIYLMPHNRKLNVLSVFLNKIFPSFTDIVLTIPSKGPVIDISANMLGNQISVIRFSSYNIFDTNIIVLKVENALLDKNNINDIFN